MSMLFTMISIVASEFLCGNLNTISNILGMNQSMVSDLTASTVASRTTELSKAGVTFLAIGNGSSDIFSTFAAMKNHSGSLAVGELFGAATFVTSIRNDRDQHRISKPGHHRLRLALIVNDWLGVS
jgi:sodium/potassium/calcium exchanger 6